MRNQPKIGEMLYVSARASDMSPLLDRTGGLATVKAWEMGISAGEQVPFVSFEEFPGSLNYESLCADQPRLSALYAGQLASHTPDYESPGDGFPAHF